MSFINLAINVAKSFPNKKIIFRPHPAQDINFVKKRFPDNLKNLHIIFKYHATSWIYNCDWFIHTHCSTFFDAELMNKKIINFYKSKYTRHKEFFNNIDLRNSFNNEKTVIQILKKNKKISSSSYVKNKLINYSENYKKNSHNEICKEISKKFKNIKTKITFNNLKHPHDNKLILLFKNILIKIKKLIQNLGIIYILDKIFVFNPNMFLNNDIIQNKGGDLNLKELNFYLKKTNKIYRSNVKIKEIDKNIFILSN